MAPRKVEQVGTHILRRGGEVWVSFTGWHLGYAALMTFRTVTAMDGDFDQGGTSFPASLTFHRAQANLDILTHPATPGSLFF